MLRRAKSFMVKNQKQEDEQEDVPELSETEHLRRNYVPITKTEPIYECKPQHRNKPHEEEEEKTITRRLRRQFSISVDNLMRNSLFKLRSVKRPVIEVQQNNASRLRMNQVKKVIK